MPLNIPLISFTLLDELNYSHKQFKAYPKGKCGMSLKIVFKAKNLKLYKNSN